MTEGHRPHRQLAPDTVGPEARKPTSRRGIADQAEVDKQHRFRDLSRGLNVEFLLAGWGDLKTDAASGVEGVTWPASAENLPANVEALVERLTQQRDRAKLLRRRYMPKGTGQERPFGLPVIDDQRLQAACASLLHARYAQALLGCREGYRPERGAGAAVRALSFDLPDGRDGSVVEADMQGFFDHMAHDGLRKLLRWRIDDRACLGLLRKGLKAGRLETDGRVRPPDTGTPPGGVVSPVLAQVY